MEQYVILLIECLLSTGGAYQTLPESFQIKNEIRGNIPELVLSFVLIL